MVVGPCPKAKNRTCHDIFLKLYASYYFHCTNFYLEIGKENMFKGLKAKW